MPKRKFITQAECLAKARILKGFESQLQAASAIGMNKTRYHRLESGTSEMTYGDYVRIRAELGCIWPDIDLVKQHLKECEKNNELTTANRKRQASVHLPSDIPSESNQPT